MEVYLKLMGWVPMRLKWMWRKYVSGELEMKRDARMSLWPSRFGSGGNRVSRASKTARQWVSGTKRSYRICRGWHRQVWNLRVINSGEEIRSESRGGKRLQNYWWKDCNTAPIAVLDTFTTSESFASEAVCKEGCCGAEVFKSFVPSAS